MRRGIKFISIALWALLAVVFGIVLTLKLRPQPAPTPAQVGVPVLFPAGDFSLTDQNDHPLASKDLVGKPYLTAFVFTRCAGPCPRMTGAMASLQAQLPKSFDMVSITVDPEYDRPAVLKAYAEQFHADESRWHFLTGKQEQVFAAALGMKIAAKPAEGQEPILHSEKLVLVDGRGQIRGYYNVLHPEQTAALLADAATIASETGSHP